MAGISKEYSGVVDPEMVARRSREGGDWDGEEKIWSKRSQPEAVVYVGSGLAGTSVSMVLGLRLKSFGVRGLLGFFWQGSGT